MTPFHSIAFACALVAATFASPVPAADAGTATANAPIATPVEIPRTSAERAARQQLPGWIIMSGRLVSSRHGRLWRFEFAKPVQTNTMIVDVDPQTGKVLSVREKSLTEQKEGPPTTPVR